MSTTTKTNDVTVTFERRSDLHSRTDLRGLDVDLWDFDSGEQAEVTITDGSSVKRVRAAFLSGEEALYDPFISVSVAADNGSSVGAFLNVEDAIALRDALNNAIAEAERSA